MVKKKICYVTTVPLTLKSFILDNTIYLNETGEFEITFVSSYDEEFEKSLPDFVNYYPITMKRGISFDGLRVIIQMYQFFKKEKFDLIQYSTPNASLYTSIAAFLARIPIRLYCQWGIVYVGFFGIKRKIFKIIEKLVCALSTNIQPDSFGNLNFSFDEKLYDSKKGEVIWNGSACGINLDKFNFEKKDKWRQEIRKLYNIDDTTFVYGFVGRITRNKGINELLEAFKKIEKENNNIKLMLVGGEENIHLLNKELYLWAKENRNIIFCGRQSEVEQYYSAMDCYILPSYREGFGMGVIEAQAMGIPVLVSNIPGPTDAMKINVTGIVCNKKDANDLYQKMLFMLEDNRYLRFKQYTHSFVVNNFEQKQLFTYIYENRKKLLGKQR